MIRVLCLVTLLASLPLVFPGRESSDDSGWDARELDARLFRTDQVKKGKSKFAPIADTVAKWNDLRQQVRTELVAKTAIGVRLSLAADTTVTSASDPMAARAGTAALPVCTLASVNAVGGSTSACSTANQPASGGKCSVSGPTTLPTQDNTTCSALEAGGPAYCSANANPANGANNASTCSTSGGVTTGSTNGSAGCSAGYDTDPANTNLSCSTTGDAAGQVCSTGQGEHQNCSAGNGTDKDVSTCSAGKGSNATTQSFCSVSNSAPGGMTNGNYDKDGNKCSAINTQAGTNNGNSCSALSAGGACSILSTQQTNAACTTINHNPPAGVPGTGTCSVLQNSGGKCSVINNGTQVSGPVGNPPRCGDPNMGQH